jgi:hypothetical protein
MAYIGRDLQYGVLDKQSFTANSSTTVFTLNSGVQNAKSLLVSVGAVIQEPDVAYTASGTTLTFTSAPTTGDAVYVIYLGKELSSASGRDDITVETATSAGATTLALGSSPVNAQAIMVFLNGVTQVPDSDYTVSGSTLTFTTAPDSGMAIMVYHIGKAAAMGVLADGSVTNPKIVTMDAAKLTGSLPSSMAADTTAIDQTIASLGIHVAVADNKASFNLPGVFIDQFESDSGILTETNVDRNTASEYVSTSSTISGAYSADANTLLLLHMEDTNFSDSSTATNKGNPTINGSVTRSSVQAKFGTYSALVGASTSNADSLEFADHSDWDAASISYTVDYWLYLNALPPSAQTYPVSRFNGPGDWGNYIDSNGAMRHGIWGTSEINTSNSVVPIGNWHHWAIVKNGGSDTKIYKDGVQVAAGSGNFSNGSTPLWIGGQNPSITSTYSLNGYIDEVRISNIARWTSNFTPNDNTTTTNATGTLISSASTAPSTVSTVSGVLVYEDATGTSTLGTDLKIYFSADNGSNWTEASSYGSTINFNGASKKLVKLGKTTISNTGTAIKIKAEWANQASGTKETRLHGWAINY